MNSRTRWLLVGVLFAGAAGSSPALAQDGSFELELLGAGPSATPMVIDGGPSATPAVIDDSSLDVMRGGDAFVYDSYNTYNSAEAEANATNSFGHVDIVGDVYGGSVSIQDNALSQFRGVVTQAFSTAPGTNVTAQTALSFSLVD